MELENIAAQNYKQKEWKYLSDVPDKGLATADLKMTDLATEWDQELSLRYREKWHWRRLFEAR